MKKLLIVGIYLLVGFLIAGGYLWYCYEDSSEYNSYSDSLIIYVWDEYIADDAIDSFEKKYGINVELITYDDEFEFEENFFNQTQNYDLVMTADVRTKKFIEEGWVIEINKKNIPNIKFLDKDFLNKRYDVGNQYSLPFSYGTTGIIYNPKYIDSFSSFDLLWSSKYSDKIGMIIDMDIILNILSVYSGVSFESKADEDFVKLNTFMQQLKNNAEFVDFKTIQEKMLNEEYWISVSYGEDYDTITEVSDDFVYALPPGSLLWIENWLIPNYTTNKVGAELFMNHMMEPEFIMDSINEYWIVMPNDEAMELADNEYLLEKADLIKSSSLRLFSDIEFSDKYYDFKNKLEEEIENE